MFIKKKSIRREGKYWNLKNALGLLIFAVSISLFSSFIYLRFFQDSGFYINPLLPQGIYSNDVVEKRLNEKKIEFKKITQEEGAVRVILKDDSEVIFSSKKDVGTQVSSLQLTLSRLTIEGKKLKIIDFRFSNPVISFR